MCLSRINHVGLDLSFRLVMQTYQFFKYVQLSYSLIDISFQSKQVRISVLNIIKSAVSTLMFPTAAALLSGTILIVLSSHAYCAAVGLSELSIGRRQS